MKARPTAAAWLASLRRRDTGGGHLLKNQIKIRPFCKSIKIKSRTK